MSSDATPWDFELVYAGEVASLAAATAELERLLARAAATPAAVYAGSLALEELFDNVVRHAWSDGGAHEIRFAARLAPEQFVLRLAYDGKEFDPTAVQAPDLHLPLEERPVGGLGIHLVRTLADRLEYRRVGAENQVTVHLPLRPKE